MKWQITIMVKVLKPSTVGRRFRPIGLPATYGTTAAFTLHEIKIGGASAISDSSSSRLFEVTVLAQVRNIATS